MFATDALAARGMWGSKRKRDEDEDVDDISGGFGSGFESKREVAKPQQKAQVWMGTFLTLQQTIGLYIVDYSPFLLESIV